MKTPSSRVPALLFALLSTAGLLAQKGGSGAELTISVTVAPICTVAVRAGDASAEEVIDLRCRNLAASQPKPLVTHAARPVIGANTDAGLGDGTLAYAAGLEMIVINF